MIKCCLYKIRGLTKDRLERMFRHKATGALILLQQKSILNVYSNVIGEHNTIVFYVAQSNFTCQVN